MTCTPAWLQRQMKIQGDASLNFLDPKVNCLFRWLLPFSFSLEQLSALKMLHPPLKHFWIGCTVFSKMLFYITSLWITVVNKHCFKCAILIKSDLSYLSLYCQKYFLFVLVTRGKRTNFRISFDFVLQHKSLQSVRKSSKHSIQQTKWQASGQLCCDPVIAKGNLSCGIIFVFMLCFD